MEVLPAQKHQIPGMPRRCGATSRKTGLRCTHLALPGLRVCKKHGGLTPASQAKSVERIAADKLHKLGVPIEGDPRDVLLKQVHYAHGMMEAASLAAQNFTSEDLVSEDRDVRNAAKAAIRIMADWSDRAARVSKMALDAGIEERQVRLAENQSLVIVSVIRGTLEALHLTPEQEQIAMQEVSSRLRAYAFAQPVLVGPNVARDTQSDKLTEIP